MNVISSTQSRNLDKKPLRTDAIYWGFSNLGFFFCSGISFRFQFPFSCRRRNTHALFLVLKVGKWLLLHFKKVIIRSADRPRSLYTWLSQALFQQHSLRLYNISSLFFGSRNNSVWYLLSFLTGTKQKKLLGKKNWSGEAVHQFTMLRNTTSLVWGTISLWVMLLFNWDLPSHTLTCTVLLVFSIFRKVNWTFILR